MRIAFDVKGTIEGPKGAVILEAFRKLQGAGHTCVVWSNLYSYATDVIAKHGLKADAMDKRSTSELEERGLEPFDVAIEDDRGQWYLGAKTLIFVDEITDADALMRLILKQEG